MENQIKNLAVFVSGSGTNMENIALHIKKGLLKNCQIQLVVCDQPNALALERARSLHLQSVVAQRETFSSKTAFELFILYQLNLHKIDFIILAGYMRILGKSLLEKYQWKILNIHPALLPAFPGAHAIRDAWAAKAKETGVTVHLVDEGVDTGPVVLQKPVQILPEDTIESLEKKIHEVEYELYPRAIQLLVDGQLRVVGTKVEISKV